MKDSIKFHKNTGIVDLNETFPDNKRLWGSEYQPIPESKRTWGYLSYIGTWSTALNVSPFVLAGSAVALGLPLMDGFIITILASLFLYFLLVVQSHAGTKYGMAEPQLTRSRFGIYGAYFASLSRAVVAIGWFAIQTYIFTEIGLGFYYVYTGNTAKLASVASLGPTAMYHANPTLFILVFATVLLLQTALVYFSKISNSQASIRRVFKINLPIAILGVAIFFIVIMSKIKWNIGSLSSVHIPLAAGFTIPLILLLFANTVLAAWVTASMNMPDLTRYAKSQKVQMLSQALLIPINIVAFTFGIIVTLASVKIFGTMIYDPVVMTTLVAIPFYVKYMILALFMYMTYTVNIQGNLIPPAYDIANVFPGKIKFKYGLLLAVGASLLLQSWILYGNAESLLESWESTYAAVLASIIGVVVCDYLFVRKLNFNPSEVFKSHGYFTYYKGINPAAFIAIGISLFLIFFPFPWHTIMLYGSGYFAVLITMPIYYLLMRFWIGPKYQPDLFNREQTKPISSNKADRKTKSPTEERVSERE
jgi:NCS1 family nucleobase:cation symporter-1